MQMSGATVDLKLHMTYQYMYYHLLQLQVLQEEILLSYLISVAFLS